MEIFFNPFSLGAVDSIIGKFLKHWIFENAWTRSQSNIKSPRGCPFVRLSVNTFCKQKAQKSKRKQDSQYLNGTFPKYVLPQNST